MTNANKKISCKQTLNVKGSKLVHWNLIFMSLLYKLFLQSKHVMQKGSKHCHWSLILMTQEVEVFFVALWLASVTHDVMIGKYFFHKIKICFS